MASSKNTQTVLWSASATVSVSAGATQTSDALSLNVEDWGGAVQLKADNDGTAASGDTVDFYAAWSVDNGTTYDTTEHAQHLATLNTYGSDTPGEDPAVATVDLNVVGKTNVKIIAVSGAGSNSITVSAKITTHRGQ